MNTFKKYCENVFVAESQTEHKKGDVIALTTKYGKEVNCEVYNLVQKANDKFYYSIVRIEDKLVFFGKSEYLFPTSLIFLKEILLILFLSLAKKRKTNLETAKNCPKNWPTIINPLLMLFKK